MTQDQQMLALYNKIRDLVMENGKKSDKPNDLVTLALLSHEVLKTHKNEFELGVKEQMAVVASKTSYDAVNMTKIRWMLDTMDWIDTNNH